jgi:hypothetical protein
MGGAAVNFIVCHLVCVNDAGFSLRGVAHVAPPEKVSWLTGFCRNLLR